MKKLYIILSLCILTCACQREESLPPQLESLSLEDTVLFLNIGESYTLHFLAFPEEALSSLTDIECEIFSGQDLEISNYVHYAEDGVTITPYAFGETKLCISGSYYHIDNYNFNRGNYGNLNGYRVSHPRDIIENNRWYLYCWVIVGGDNLEVTVPNNKITTTTAELKCNEDVIKNCSRIEISLSGNRHEVFNIDNDTDCFLVSGLMPGTQYSGTVRFYAKNSSYDSDNYQESEISFSTKEPEIEIATTFTTATITLDAESYLASTSISISLTDKDDRTNSITEQFYTHNYWDSHTIYNLRPNTQYVGYIYIRLRNYTSLRIPISISTKDLKMNLSYDRYENYGSNHYLYLNLSLENDKTYDENNIIYRVGCQFSDTANFQSITDNSTNYYNENKNPQEYEVYTSWYGYTPSYYCRPFIELNSGEIIYDEHYEFDVSSRTLTKYSIQ